MQASKRAIKAVLNERTVSDEVLVTVFVEVTALLNDRLLTTVSTDRNDANPLTPNLNISSANLINMFPLTTTTLLKKTPEGGGDMRNSSSVNTGRDGCENMCRH